MVLDGSVGKDSACSAGDTGDVGSVLGLRRSPGGGHDNPLQYSCLENPMDRGAWWAIVQRVAKSQTQLGSSTNRSQKWPRPNICVYISGLSKAGLPLEDCRSL